MDIDLKIIEENKKLIEKYPFLKPVDIWDEEVPEDYDYSYTNLDFIPIGWKKAFGELLCEDIKNELLKIGELENYRIVQMKEKYGSLRLYDSGGNEAIRDIIWKYEYISERVCVRCGKFDVNLFDDGWVCPWCDECFVNYRNRIDDIPNETKKIEFTKENIDDLNKYRLEKEPLKIKVRIESMGKNGCSWRELDITNILRRMGVNGY